MQAFIFRPYIAHLEACKGGKRSRLELSYQAEFHRKSLIHIYIYILRDEGTQNPQPATVLCVIFIIQSTLTTLDAEIKQTSHTCHWMGDHNVGATPSSRRETLCYMCIHVSHISLQ